MKRRNADIGKMRRPVKRTKIVEGMYGSSMVYVKFVMVWATVVIADYMLEFRLEFLWPFWLMLRTAYESFKYQGLMFSASFLCIALTSDMICFFFIPLQYLIFAASTYVWVQFIWYTFADKGVCVSTVALCCVVVYVEGAVRARAVLELWRPLAAHCLGYPAISLGFGVKAYVGQRLRLRRQRQVRAENEFYFQLLRDALPESALEQKPEESKSTSNGECTQATQTHNQLHAQTHTHMNGAERKRCARDHNGVCIADHALHAKLDKLEKHIQRDKCQVSVSPGAAHTDGAGDEHDHWRTGSKSSKSEKKEAINVTRKNKNKDKDSNDSHKSTEITKEILVKDKDVESTKETVKSNKELNSHKEREREREKEREKEKERERERERKEEKERERREEREREKREEREREKKEERERERREEREKELKDREREQKDQEQRARSLSSELRRVRAELTAARAAEAEARRALAQDTKESRWRSSERLALERRLSEERRARTAAENQLKVQQAARMPSGECDSSWCRSRRAAAEAESLALRRELQRARERAAQLQRELAGAADQVRALEAWEAREALERSRADDALSAASALQDRAAHLERSLSAETRVKLDLLSALGDAKRHMRIQESLISRQEKELEELKAQMLAVMPTEFVTPVTSSVSKLRLSDGSPLDPNATVYTPKQLCSDA